MAFPGEILEDPITGRRTVFNRTASSSGGTAYDTEVLYRPHTGREANNPHYHRSFDEKFEVLSGVATYAINGVKHQALAGQTITIPRGTVHLNPWNATDENLHLRHYFELDQPDFVALKTYEDIYETLIGLARDSKIKPDGTPKSFLQLAVLLHAVQPHSYAAGVPEFVQRALFGALASIGRAAGYRVSYPQYSQNSNILPTA
jgi:mannose-6-phosphate isomerase-like protein (cupin superfamily)